ncbi:hypothetical protein MLD38_000871 [Melastoma candidum]|uniref:Uncharacterized protein n=1 Tax=Melastoma candidum TaxID=119954 RepID=A0ACB9SK20_9MYRT|nr:hypothetical protein MLD38_000871 [Melastoma candidum]
MKVRSYASTSISDEVFASQGPAIRHLLQAKKSCPVNFEFLNYSNLTNKCKGPKYSSDICCPAFKDLACPYAEYLNDLTNDCASTMFSYINLYGKYPPGLFSSECLMTSSELVLVFNCKIYTEIVAPVSHCESHKQSRTASSHSEKLTLLLLAVPSFLTLLRLNKVSEQSGHAMADLREVLTRMISEAAVSARH